MPQRQGVGWGGGGGGDWESGHATSLTLGQESSGIFAPLNGE